jgi:hypothetical protein
MFSNPKTQAWKGGHKRKCAPVRFQVGDRVLCSRGTLKWGKGKILRHSYEEPAGVFHPYQLRCEDGEVLGVRV